MTVISIIIFTFLSDVFSQDEKREYSQTIMRENDNIFLRTRTCLEAQRHVKDLAKWTEKTNKKCDIDSVTYDQGLNCKVNISKCVPDHVLKYEGLNPQEHGPNCWNLAMVMTGIIPYMRYSTPQEMAFFMDAPLCRPLKPYEKRKTGDIGAIRNSSDRKDIHGFIHISEDLVYSKNGNNKDNYPYKVQNFDSMLNEMFIGGTDHLKNECRGNQAIGKVGCLGQIEYFRCISLDEYLKKENDQISKEIKETLSTFQKIDCHISSVLFDLTVADQAVNLSFDISFILYQYLVDQLDSNQKLSEQDTFILSSIKLRLEALRESLGGTYEEQKRDKISPHLQSSDSSDKLSLLKTMINNSIKTLEKTIKPIDSTR